MIEQPIEDWVCDQAEKAGWLVRKLRWIGRRSACDKFFAKDGRIVLIEFKRPKKAPSEVQLKEIQRLRDAGVEVHVVDTPLAGLRVLGIDYA